MTSGTNRTLRMRTVALAGLFQAARLVQQTARGMLRDPIATQASIASLFALEADSVPAVFGGVDKLRVGLDALVKQLDSTSGGRDMELTGYVVTLLHLERKLSKQRTMLERITTGIAQIPRSTAPDEYNDPTTIAALAHLYEATLSTLSPRVLVRGEQSLLENPDTRNRIRCLLLAGIRAAVLWQQCGGNRWRLLVERRRMLAAAQELLQGIRRGIY